MRPLLVSRLLELSEPQEGARASLVALWAEVARSSSAGMGQWFGQELFSAAMLSRALEFSPVYALQMSLIGWHPLMHRDRFRIIRCNPFWMVWIM